MDELNEEIKKLQENLKAAYSKATDAMDELGGWTSDFSELQDKVVEELEATLDAFEGEELVKREEILDAWREASPEEIDTELSYGSDQAFEAVERLPKV